MDDAARSQFDAGAQRGLMHARARFAASGGFLLAIALLAGAPAVLADGSMPTDATPCDDSGLSSVCGYIVPTPATAAMPTPPDLVSPPVDTPTGCDYSGDWETSRGQMTLIRGAAASGDGDDPHGTLRYFSTAMVIQGHRPSSSATAYGTWRGGYADQSGGFSITFDSTCDSFSGIYGDDTAIDHPWTGTRLGAATDAANTGLPTAEQIAAALQNELNSQNPPPTPVLGATPTSATTSPTQSVHVTDTPAPGVALVGVALVVGALVARRARR